MGRLVLFAWLASGCLIDVTFGAGHRCSDGICPDGQDCVAGVCVESGSLADAALDAPADIGSPSVAEHVIGNRLFLPFNDASSFGVFRDYSGNRRDAFHNFATGLYPAGKFGTGLNPTELAVTIADTPLLFPVDASGVTIEAWVSNAAGLPAIFGDPTAIIANDRPATTQLAFYMGTVDDGNGGFASALSFAAMDGCAGVVERALVPATVRNDHLAATWDGAEVLFYKNGEQIGEPQPLIAAGCDLDRDFAVGRTLSNTGLVDEYVDELKVSAGIKTSAQLLESMDFDSATLTDCGNFVLEAGEQCDSDASCCDQARCRFEPVGSACGRGACNEGACITEGRGRIDSDAVVLYDFSRVEGGSIIDTSLFEEPLNLVVPVGAEVVFRGQAMTVSGTIPSIVSAVPATKVVNAVEDGGGEFSVEVWIQPSDPDQAGPARIVSLSTDTLERNVMIGQTAGAYIGRVRSAGGTNNGIPELHSPSTAVVTSAATHLVLTRDAQGNRRLWINGVLVEQSTVSGALGWDPTYPLRLANEGGDTRPFAGTFFFVAIYATAFDDERIGAHFAAGPG